MKKKLHYENLAGVLVRRNGMLSWRCPDCHKSGESRRVRRFCPECKNARDNKRPNRELNRRPFGHDAWHRQAAP